MVFAVNITMTRNQEERTKIMLDTRQIYSLSDFVRNPKLHVARLKETRTPEVLTVNGRAEVVLLDTETYEELVARLDHVSAVASLRTHMAQARREEDPRPEMTDIEREAEIERSQAVMRELVEETERLGLYK